MSGGSLIFQKPVSLLNGGTGLAVEANLGFDSFMRVNNGDTTITLAQVDPNYANSTPTYTNITTTTINNFIAPSSGSYTPTLTDVANISSHGTVSDLTYLRVGNSCTVSGRVSIDPTSPSTTTELGVSLPFASNFSLFTDCGGTASASFGGVVAQVCGIRADTTNDRAALIFTSTANVAASDWAIHFTYKII